MSEFEDHLRKDVQMIRSDSMFVLLITALAVIAFIVAFQASSSYVNSWSPKVVTRQMIEELQMTNLDLFWTNTISTFLLIFSIVSSMMITPEKENGMVRYVLTFGTHKWQFYLSKFLMITALAIFASLISALAYFVVFTSMDLPMLDVTDMLSAMALPLLTIMVICSIGLMISAFANKKGTAIALGIVVFLVITVSYTFIDGMAYQAARNDPDWTWGEDEVDFIPWYYKILLKMNPIVLIAGGQYLDGWEGVWIGLGMIAVYLALGIIVFSRERTEYGLIKDTVRKIGKLKRRE